MKTYLHNLLNSTIHRIARQLDFNVFYCPRSGQLIEGLDSWYSDHLQKIQNNEPSQKESSRLEGALNSFKKDKKYKQDPGYQFLLPHLSILFPDGKTTSVLDLGCSFGTMAIFLEDQGFRDRLNYHGLEADAAYAKCASHCIPWASFSIGNFNSEFELQNKHFDVVVAKGSICLAPNPIQTLQELFSSTSFTYFALLHSPHFEDASSTAAEGYIDTIYTSKWAHPFKIMSRDALISLASDYNLQVFSYAKRPKWLPVVGWGGYYLEDIIFKRRLES